MFLLDFHNCLWACWDHIGFFTSNARQVGNTSLSKDLLSLWPEHQKSPGPQVHCLIRADGALQER